MLALRETQVIHKRTRWTIFALKPTDETTERMYDELWAVLGDEKRHLSVARNAGAMWAVLYKGDEKVAALAGISALRAVYEIRKPLGGGAARNAVANFGRVWFASSSEHTSDFDLSPDDEDVPMEAVYEDVAELTDRQHLFRLGNAKQKRPHERTPHEKALVAGKSEINALRAMDTREAKAVAEKRRDPCHRRVTSEGLHMPADFDGVGEWRGKTWDPETRTMKKVSFLEYLDTEMHLERTAVLYSDAGSGKTPALNATARTFAMRYQDADPYYLSAGTVDGFKAAYRKGLVKKGVPHIIEDFRPLGNPNGNRQKLEEYIVNLLNVKDGGSVDTAGGMQMTFPPTTPQLMSTNDKFGRWIEGFERLPREKRHAIFKRVVFFTVPDAPLVKAELRKRRQDDLRSVVAAGKRREREFLIHRLATTPSTTASAASVGDSEESDFEPFPGGESAPVTPPVAPARTPDSDGGSEDESATSPPPLVAEEELIGRSAAPFGPDAGKPLFARLPTFVAVYLVFASDVLARLGEIDRKVFEHYLAELRELDPSAADAYSGTCHCTVSFLTDTTTLKLLKAWLNDGEITEDALYNVVVGQTVLPSWRRLETLGPVVNTSKCK